MDKRHLWKRSNVYWVRVRVPDSVRDTVGKSQLSKNLYTKDLVVANRIKHKVVIGMMETIEHAKRINDSTLLTKEERIKQKALLIRDTFHPVLSHSERIEMEVEGEYGWKTNMAFSHEDDFEEKHPETHKTIKSAIKIANPDKYPLSVLTKEFITLEKKRLKPATCRRKEKHINEFIEYYKDVEIIEITKKLCSDYAHSILEIKDPAHETLRNTILDISTLFSWAESRGYTAFNPFYRLKLPLGRKKVQERVPWADENIIRFLTSDFVARNDFIATAIALYTGMRLDEICMLKYKHIFDDLFHIYEGKTEAARRVVPVHPVLKNILDSNDSDNEEYLLKGLVSGGYDTKRSSNFQKRNGKIRKKLDLPKGVVFHSLRNTVINKLHNNLIPLYNVEQIIGHKQKSVAFGVYSGGLAVQHLREIINGISYGNTIDNLILNYKI
jgi:integrase